MTDSSRLKLDVYEWWTQSPLKTISYNCTAPLPSFLFKSLPIFVIPVPHSDGCLVLITESRVVLLKLSDILSGRFDYTECLLPSFPVAFFQERIFANNSGNPVSTQYDDIQHIYLSTESNVIYTIVIDATNDILSIQPLVDLNVPLGSSLVISPCSESGDLDVALSINEAPYLMIYIAGDGVPGGTFFVRSTEDGVVTDYLSDFQRFGPLCDALMLNPLDVFESTSPNLQLRPNSELLVASGSSGPSTSAIVHIRQGLKASVALAGLPMQGIKQLFSAVSKTASFVVASYPYYSSVFQILNGESSSDTLEIIDFGEQSRLNLHAETLAFSIFDNSLIQVTPLSVSIASLDHDHLLAITDLTILRAHILDDYVAIVSKKDMVVSLGLYRFNPELLPSSDALQLQAETVIDAEITMLKIMYQNSLPSIYLGTFTSTLRVYSADLEFVEIFLEDVANDVATIGNTLLVGMRTGAIWYKDAEIAIAITRPLDKLPVQFFQNNDTTFAFCEFIYSIDHDFPLDVPHRVVIDYPNLFSVQAACMFPVSSISTDSEVVIAAVVNQNLNILVVDKKPSPITRRIPVRAVPRRILYLSHVGMIAVLFHRSCKKSRQSHLRFVDPKRGTVVTPNEDYDAWKSKLPRHSTDEVMYCMAEWEFRVNGNRFKYLVIGSGATEGSRPCGYIYLMTVSKSKSGRVEIQKRFVLQEEDAVYSVAQIDERTLICATHSKLVLYRLVVESDQKCKIIKLGSIDPMAGAGLQPSVIFITVTFNQKNGLVYAATLKNSVYVYQYVDMGDTGTLKLLCSDGILRSCVTHCVLDDGMLVIADKQRNVAVYKVPTVSGPIAPQVSSNSEEGSAPTPASASAPTPTPTRTPPVQVSSSTLKLVGSYMLPSTIAKLIPVAASQTSSPCSSQSPNTQGQDIIAVAVNGSLYRLQLVNEETYVQLAAKIKDVSAHAPVPDSNAEHRLTSERWKDDALKTKRTIDWEAVNWSLSHDRDFRTFSRLNGVI